MKALALPLFYCPVLVTYSQLSVSSERTKREFIISQGALGGSHRTLSVVAFMLGLCFLLVSHFCRDETLTQTSESPPGHMPASASTRCRLLGCNAWEK